MSPSPPRPAGRGPPATPPARAGRRSPAGRPHRPPALPPGQQPLCLGGRQTDRAGNVRRRGEALRVEGGVDIVAQADGAQPLRLMRMLPGPSHAPLPPAHPAGASGGSGLRKAASRKPSQLVTIWEYHCRDRPVVVPDKPGPSLKPALDDRINLRFPPLWCDCLFDINPASPEARQEQVPLALAGVVALLNSARPHAQPIASVRHIAARTWPT
jgi:hypothetical protein